MAAERPSGRTIHQRVDIMVWFETDP